MGVNGAVELEAGALLADRYRIAGRLGKGGMGDVYDATDERTGRRVALKRLTLRLGDAATELKFRREFHTLATLRHPRIVEVHDYDSDGAPFYTMEVLDGVDLRDAAPVEARGACRLLRDVASALAFLHSRRLIHRDVAPRNVRCTSDGRAKLLDFGVLATIGVTGEVVGTLPCIAPETTLGVPLDERADLFGLGALAYWLLTKTHARPIRRLEDLVRIEYAPPRPPSRLADGVPAALDDLVLSLLAKDPLARPARAVEVIDRLVAIGELDPAPELAVARSYVQSTALVGRDREMAVARRRVERALAASGRAVLVRGRAGSGKSRMLREIALEAKLAGFVVIRADVTTPSPYGVAATLVAELARAAPEEAREEAAGHEAVLRRVEPRTAESLNLPDVALPSADPRELRLAIQAGLSEWFFGVAARRPLCLVVDDVHRADEASLSLLAGLGREARRRPLLVLAAAAKSGVPHARDPFGVLETHALTLRARGLSAAEIEELVRAMFGDAPGLGALASWLRGAVGGSPLLCTEVLRHLVDRGTLRLEGGLWLIPTDLDRLEVPRSLRDTMDARVSAIEDPARRIGQILSLLDDSAPVELIASLSEVTDDLTFAALNDLVAGEVLVGSPRGYAFRHDGLRDALRRTLSRAERARLERRIGEALARDPSPSPERESRTGWHLLRGGERQRAAVLLARAGRRAFEATSFRDAIPALEAALDVLSSDPGSTSAERCELLQMLVTAGFYADRDAALRHREAALEALAKEAGVLRARRLVPYVGVRLAMIVALVIAAALYWSVGRRRGRLRPAIAIAGYLRVVAYSAGVAGFSFDTARLRDSVDALREVRALPRAEVRGIVRFVHNLLAFNLGRLRTLLASTDAGLADVARNATVANAVELAVASGGARFQRGLAWLNRADDRAMDEIRALDGLGLRLWRVGAFQLRTIRHLWRGEDTQAAQLWREAEAEAVRLGSVWQLDGTLHPSMVIGHGYTGDVIGLKRSITALSEIVSRMPGYALHLHIARAEYARLRGQHEDALEHVRRALAAHPPGEGLTRPWAQSALADVLLDAGRLEEARDAARAALDDARDEDHRQPLFHFRSVATLALAEGALGDTEAARARLDEALASAVRLGNPLVTGTLHEAAARVAHARADGAELERHFAAASECFRSTENPVLIARVDRLARLGASESLRAGVDWEGETVVGDPASIASSVLSHARGTDERAERALEILLAATRGASGFLFLIRRGRLDLAAPTRGDEPPAELRTHVEKLAACDADRESTLLPAPPAGSGPWHAVPLRVDTDGGAALVAVAAIAEGDRPLVAPLEEVAKRVARALYDEGDVVTTPSTATMTLTELAALSAARRQEK